jgi:glutaredoxin-like protein
MTLLDDKTREGVVTLLSDLADPVRVLVFTQASDCQFCDETRQLVEEVSDLSDLITLDVFDAAQDADQVEAYGVDKFPAIVILGAGDRDYGVRYYGIPSGYEFTSLLHGLRVVSAGPGGTGLSEETITYLDGLETPTHLQVFITPTCSYCPRAVVLAHAMAVASDKVRADMVEAMEFPDLANRYHVMGVPRTVINEREYVEGAVPEPVLLAQIRVAVARSRLS